MLAALPDEQHTLAADGSKASSPHEPLEHSLLELQGCEAASLVLAQTPPIHALLAQMLSVVPHCVPTGWSVQK